MPKKRASRIYSRERGGEVRFYADFRDFNFYRLAVERAHLVAGFGRIHWLDAAALLVPPAPALSARETDIVQHMNDDHQDAIDACVRGLLGLAGDGWRLTGVDPEGCDLRRGPDTARLAFGRAVLDAEGARAELVRLTRAARSRLAATLCAAASACRAQATSSSGSSNSRSGARQKARSMLSPFFA